MNRRTVLLASAALGLALSTTTAFAQDKGTIGVLMPTKSSQRWIQDGDNMVKALQERGYRTDLQYAEDDIPTQLSQAENMVSAGVKVLVIASIDGTTLTDVLKQAHDKDIKIIAYDRLIRNSPDVDYYTTFDKLDLANKPGPFNIELFGGSPDDNNATFFYNGAMSVLQPYIDQGKLVIQSGETGLQRIGTLRWDPATAQARMDNLLSAYYGDGKRVDAILSPNDSLAIGIISALTAVGYGSGDMPMPVISGQDADLPSVKAILAGQQYSTVFKDTRELAKVTVDMIDAIGSGKEPEVNDTTTYDNGAKVVPSHLLKPVLVTKDDIQSVIVDSGYYTQDQLR